jgi:hypothetical protein
MKRPLSIASSPVSNKHIFSDSDHETSVHGDTCSGKHNYVQEESEDDTYEVENDERETSTCYLDKVSSDLHHPKTMNIVQNNDDLVSDDDCSNVKHETDSEDGNKNKNETYKTILDPVVEKGNSAREVRVTRKGGTISSHPNVENKNRNAVFGGDVIDLVEDDDRKGGKLGQEDGDDYSNESLKGTMALAAEIFSIEYLKKNFLVNPKAVLKSNNGYTVNVYGYFPGVAKDSILTDVIDKGKKEFYFFSPQGLKEYISDEKLEIIRFPQSDETDVNKGEYGKSSSSSLKNDPLKSKNQTILKEASSSKTTKSENASNAQRARRDREKKEAAEKQRLLYERVDLLTKKVDDLAKGAK